MSCKLRIDQTVHGSAASSKVSQVQPASCGAVPTGGHLFIAVFGKALFGQSVLSATPINHRQICVCKIAGNHIMVAGSRAQSAACWSYSVNQDTSHSMIL